MSFSGLSLFFEYLFGGLMFIPLIKVFPFPLILNTESLYLIIPFAYLWGLVADNLMAPITRSSTFFLNKFWYKLPINEKSARKIYNIILNTGHDGHLKRLQGYESTRRFIRISFFNLLFFVVLAFCVLKVDFGILINWCLVLMPILVFVIFMLIDYNYLKYLIEFYSLNMNMKTILVDAVGTFVVDGKINEDLHKLLETYPNRKIILTNANDEQLVTFGLVNMPYEMFTLKHNPDKVDPKYFETFLKRYNLDKSDVIYFEHSQEAVDSAKSVGIVSHFYDADKKDLVSLKEFLDNNISQ